MNFARSNAINDAVKLFLCGALALFCELFLIRWLGSCIPSIKFYSNFILMSSFFGLGVGALCVRFNVNLYKYIFLLLFITISLGPLLSNISQFIFLNFGFIEQKNNLLNFSNFKILNKIEIKNADFLILITIYSINAFLFLIFGQSIGKLFKSFKPLIAYTIEIGGSILGILIFSIVNELLTSPLISIIIIFILAFIVSENKRKNIFQFLILLLLTMLFTFSYSKNFIWSSYNKISLFEMSEINNTKKEKTIPQGNESNYLININNHYNQFILDLREGKNKKLEEYREFYDIPYRSDFNIPDGPILIIGAGGGNEVAAALRHNHKDIDIIEIDQSIIEICKKFHPEKPFDNPNVKIQISDARSFIKNTQRKYSRIIFAFSEINSLLSYYNSIRLENFLFTYESMSEFNNILLSNGKIFISLSQKETLQIERLIKLLKTVFNNDTNFFTINKNTYFKAITFVNGKFNNVKKTENEKLVLKEIVNTDNWPFWYLNNEKLPKHYIIFITMIIISGLLCLLFLPKGQRKIQFSYFFLGAGFFLIETSNVTSLSLLFGSNSMVNITVFIWILGLILLGNFTCFILKRFVIYRIFGILILSLLVSYFIPPSIFLIIKIKWLQSIIAGFVFLCPIYFASLIFAHIIQREKNFYQAYGSNLLGAVVGGAFEYSSLIFGIKFLLIITAIFYVLAALSIKAKIQR